MGLAATGFRILRPLLFRLEAETAHRLVLKGLRGAQPLLPLAGRPDSRLEQRLFGLRFPGPVGLAAGFDKDGEVVRAMTALGFGAVEVGTVTPRAQPGNPRPRLFRHAEHASLQNRLGFNNAGGEALARRLARLDPPGKRPIPVGVNIGRNKTTPPESALDDYLALVGRLDRYADYFTINVSSPNTPGLRDLQTVDVLRRLVSGSRELTRRPLLVKLSPDLELETARDLGQAAVEAGAAGLILTNTTTNYALLPGAEASGGLSGRVLRERSFELLAALAGDLYGRCTLVSVGGIDSGDEAYRRLKAGASLVQLYSALVFRGPELPRRIHSRLAELLERDGYDSLSQAIGADLPAAERRRNP